jgi:hypothetical protein
MEGTDQRHPGIEMRVARVGGWLLQWLVTYVGCFLLILGTALRWRCIWVSYDSPICDSLFRVLLNRGPSTEHIEAVVAIGVLAIVVTAALPKRRRVIQTWQAFWGLIFLLLIPPLRAVADYPMFIFRAPREFWELEDIGIFAPLRVPLVDTNQSLGALALLIALYGLVSFWLVIRPASLRRRGRLWTLVILAGLMITTSLYLGQGVPGILAQVHVYMDQPSEVYASLSEGPRVVWVAGLVLLVSELTQFLLDLALDRIRARVNLPVV